MKFIAIGDIHGRKNWKEIVSKNDDADKIIFIGDYFDTHENISSLHQQENFKDIIEYKKSRPDKVALLFGNHDFHYLPCTKQQYSGYQKASSPSIEWLLTEALRENLLQMCFIHGKFIFTHAGVTKTWCINNEIDMMNIESSINELFKYKPNAFEFTPGPNNNPYGDDECQTPIWVRPHSLLKDHLNGFIQVVGHTTQDRINQTAGIIVKIDTLGTSGEYLKVEDGVIEAVL